LRSKNEKKGIRGQKDNGRKRILIERNMKGEVKDLWNRLRKYDLIHL